MKILYCFTGYMAQHATKEGAEEDVFTKLRK